MAEFKKIRSRQELLAEITRLEQKLEKEKEEVKDNFSVGSIIISLLPEFLRVEFSPGQEVNVFTYLTNVAGNFISFREKK